MIRIASLAGLFLLLVLTGLSFLPGSATRDIESRFDLDPVVRSHAYFRTPRAAVERMGEMLAEGDMTSLTPFLDRGDTARKVLESAPFRADLDFLGAIQTEYEDIYEVALGTRTEAGLPIVETVIFLKRYPEGYQLMLARPTQEDKQSG